MIKQAKFYADRSMCRLLARAALPMLMKRSNVRLPDVFVPVPLHKQRLRDRGFNQAHQIAKEFGAALTTEVDWRACEKITETPAQSSLESYELRRRNVTGVFKVVDRDAIANRHIAIVDDVMTSTATARSLSLTLLAAGANTVDVWICARATSRRQLTR